ncbi:uncharacterized protein LOC119077593 isoform X1 [Bradysia coprophila]|uniref:uncharacterized protein LOC119077593 isoform X1 n=1 Tax=Bradysia coprophila TaxID=38358 RepID=UPI00187D71BF|nr:uncharacterized protein LOC119077593 isoform X1 [Bradysia coprophila]
MQRSESASAPDSQSPDIDQSSTTSGYFSEMEFQRDDSDESMEEELSSSCEASSSSQNNSCVLTEKERSRSQTNWQHGYFQAEPDVASVKSVSPFRQKSNATQGRSAATLIASKWNATTIGSRSAYEEQLQSNRRTFIPKQNGRSQAKMQLHYSEAVPSLAGFERIYGNKTGYGDQFASTIGSSSESFDSDKTFDELFSGPYGPTSLARKLLKKAEKERREESKQRMAVANSKMRSKWPMYQTRYSPEVLTETAVNSKDLFALSTTPWYEQGYEMSLITPVDALQPTSEEWNETGDGVSRQCTTLTSSRELETAPVQGENDEMLQLNGDLTLSPNESEPGDSFDSLSLARKLLKKAEKGRREESKQRMAVANSKMRSKWPMYQTRYSPEMLTETAVNSKDLFALSTTPWYEQGYEMSLITPVDALQPTSEEWNETGDGVSRQCTTLTSSRELETAPIQGENDEMLQLNADLTSSPNESEPGDSFDSLSLARKLLKNKDRPLDIKRSILITNPNVWSNRPLFQTRYSPEVLSETVVSSNEQHPLATSELRLSIESKPIPAVNESEIEITESLQTTPAIEQQAHMQSSKCIDPTTDIRNVSIEEKPQSPQHLDDSISVPAAPLSDALNEIIISESALSEYSNDKPIGEEKCPTAHVSPEPLIQQTNIENVLIEEKRVSPPESPQNMVDSMKAPVTSQSDLWNNPALRDHRYSKLFLEFTTPPVSPAEFIVSSNSSNVLIEQPTIWPTQSLEDKYLSAVSTPAGLSDVNTPAASQSDVNEILISVPPDPSVETTSSLPPPASAISADIMPLLEKPNAVPMPNPLRPTASRPNSSVKGQKRSYNRNNKIHIQSNELIDLALPVGTIIQTPSNAARINPDQMIFDQKTSNIQMASKSSLKLRVTNEVTPNQINPAKRKRTENLQRFKSSVSNETGANSTTTGVASLKRTHTEHLSPHVPAKVQKVQKPAQTNMKNISASSTSANIATPRTDVKNCAAVAGVSRDGQNSGDPSFAECVLFLKRNNVSVFKVPQNPSQLPPKPSQVLPPNWDKYMRVLQQNNVSVERLNKNISRN